MMNSMLLPLLLAAAPQAAEDNAKARELDKVQVTATRVAEALSAIPTAVSVIDREEIKRDHAQTPIDLMRKVPGVFVQHTTPGQGTPIVRGLKGSEVLHLVDGFRLNNAFFRNAPNQYFALVDAQNIDRIEVARGPASTLYGSDAMGGVVQVLTPSVGFATGDTEYSGLSRSIYSTAELQRSTHIRGAMAGQSAAVDLGLTYNKVGALDVGEGANRLPFTNYKAYGGNLKARFKIAEGQELVFNYQDQKQPSTPRHDVLLRGFGPRPENAEFQFQPNRRQFAQLRYLITSGLFGIDTIEAQLGRQRIDDDRVLREFGTFNRDFEQNRSTLDGLVLQASRGWSEHSTVFGADLYFDRVDSALQRVDIRTGASSLPAARFPNDSFQRSLGFFVNDDWRISDQLDLISGIRWSNQATILKPADRGIGVNVDFDDFSGQLGLRYSLTDEFALVGNLGRGFRAPNIFDLGTFGNRPGNRFNKPNPNVEPETILSGDFGFKYSSEGITLEGFLFKSRYDDKIVSVLTGEVISGRQVTESRNVSKVDLYGAEFGMRYRSAAWEAWASASLVRADEQASGLETDGDRIPPLNGSLGARWYYSDQLSFEGYSFFAADQRRLSARDATDARINPNGTPGHMTANMAVAYEQGPWFARLALENAFDLSYRQHGSGIDQPGRNLILSFERNFDF